MVFARIQSAAWAAVYGRPVCGLVCSNSVRKRVRNASAKLSSVTPGSFMHLSLSAAAGRVTVDSPGYSLVLRSGLGVLQVLM
ncbi:hypothetical protein GCM10009533_66040 [Saccharopolyspora spinosporotrichia]|uniref:Uncharacterized protein n=1 Tax=Saccharopolyspora erythraea TaxID=1836 RepID=A0ABN1E5G2_SACER